MLSDYYAPTMPIDAILFDCDGTLSHIEGIDELARENGSGEPVMQLTADAMGRSGMNPTLFDERLKLVLPTAKQVTALGQTYFQNLAPDLLPVINIFSALGKKFYIISAGLYPAIAPFAALLKIDAKNIFAVDIYFDNQGNYADFDRDSPLVHADGKRKIVQQLKLKHSQLLYIGDGLNDVATRDLVTRFVGYGGAYYRENIAALCEFYITQMVALLPLTLTKNEISHLSSTDMAYFDKGLIDLKNEMEDNL